MFAHGSGSSRLSPRNAFVATCCTSITWARCCSICSTRAEAADRRNVFDIGLLGARVAVALDWLAQRGDLAGLRVGLFGASTGAAAALHAAAERPGRVGAVVSRGGRPDLAGATPRPRRGADAADRRRPRPRGAATQPRGDARDDLPQAARDRSRRDATCSRSPARWTPRPHLAGAWFETHLATREHKAMSRMLRRPCRGRARAGAAPGGDEARAADRRPGAAARRRADRAPKWRACCTPGSTSCWCARSAFPGSPNWPSPRWWTARRPEIVIDDEVQRLCRRRPRLHRGAGPDRAEGDRAATPGLPARPRAAAAGRRDRRRRRRRHRHRHDDARRAEGAAAAPAGAPRARGAGGAARHRRWRCATKSTTSSASPSRSPFHAIGLHYADFHQVERRRGDRRARRRVESPWTPSPEGEP